MAKPERPIRGESTLLAYYDLDNDAHDEECYGVRLQHHH
jgi:hypothetical protein